MQVKYPDITVQLTGTNGNAFAVMGSVRKAMRRNDVSPEDIDAFMKEAMSGDYDNLLSTCMKYVNVE